MAPPYGWREPERSIRNAHTAKTMPAPVARATRTPPMRSLDQRRATQTKPKMLIDRFNAYAIPNHRLGASRLRIEICSPHDVKIRSTLVTLPLSGTARFVTATVRNTAVMSKTYHRARTPETSDSSQTWEICASAASSRRKSSARWPSAGVRAVTSTRRHAPRVAQRAQWSVKMRRIASRRDCHHSTKW